MIPTSETKPIEPQVGESPFEICACGYPSASAIRSLSIDGPSGRLEAVLNEGAPDAPFAALVCHPHPLYGGSLHNKVVYHAMKVLNDPVWGFSYPVLRFNFRGTGISQGTHDGEAEFGDVLAAMTWLHTHFHRPLVVAGFSFGAAMALNACSRSEPIHDKLHALVALGLPTTLDLPAYRYTTLKTCTTPKLFVSGDRDQFAPPAQLSHVVSSAAEPKSLVILPGADHFFNGHLELMQQTIANWLKERMP